MSTKTVADKLLIRPGSRVWTSDPDRLALVGPLPDGATATDDLSAATVAILYVDDAATARHLLAVHGDGLAAAGVLWIAYPKGGRTDINRDSLWPIAGDVGLRPIGQVAIDDTWSALRFRPLAEGEATFTGGR